MEDEPMRGRAWRRFLIVGVLMASSLTAWCATHQADWPQWRGPNGNGISTETGWNPLALNGGAKILWDLKVGMGYSSVAVEDSRLYTMGLANWKTTLYCVNAMTGKVLWQSPVGGGSGFPQSTPAVAGDRVYGLGDDGTLVCLQAVNGQIVWKRNLQDDFHAKKPTQMWAASPVVEGDLLLINANTVEMALDRHNGDLKWSIQDPLPAGSWGSYSTPVVGELNGKRYALFFGPSTLNAVDVNTGKIAWSYSHGDTFHTVADPVVVAGRVFLSTPKLAALIDPSGDTPSVAWSSALFATWLPGPVAVDGYLYGSFPGADPWITSWEGVKSSHLPLRCIDSKTGDIKWETDIEYVSLMAADGKLIMLDLDGTLRIAEATPESFRELSHADVLGGSKSARTFATPPVLCNGRIYCRNFPGDLVCIDVSN
jgi:outer membrane protein assembly factor BamB